MTPQLESFLLHNLIMHHPLPWRVEEDWAAEIYDANNALVIKLPDGDLVKELIALATKENEEQKRADVEIEKLLGGEQK